MNVGFLGLGKLGLPCALAIEQRGHSVIGRDIDENVRTILETRRIPYREEGAEEALRNSAIRVVDLDALVAHSEIVFVAIQTPHEPEFEGITRLPKTRADFDYTPLRAGVGALSAAIEARGVPRIVSVVSTVLPGTVERELMPLLGPNTKLCYNPFFIAMGTAIHDFANPEFVLLGVDDEGVARAVAEFHATIHDRPVYRTAVHNAELIKVSYNTFIGMKIAFANVLMEFCHARGCDVDAVTEALTLATDRLISPKYLRAGMGDGGGCHPRDNIALSWLAKEVGLSFDLFEAIMIARERHCDWLADVISKHAHEASLPIVLLGITFKENTNLTVGSPALLLESVLRERGVDPIVYDPHVHPQREDLPTAVYFIGSRHVEFGNFAFPAGSVVIDPWRYIGERDGVRVVSLGAGPR